MLPNLIVIGAQKCGTTSLHYYLSLHPQISMSSPKELDFFIEQRNWHLGLQWYESHFTGEARVYGESSPNYTNYPFYRDVPDRMFAYVPEAKLIYILRNPIERIVSHYLHAVDLGNETRGLFDVLADLDNNRYVARSNYYLQLSQFLKYFPSSHILVLTQENLMLRRRETLREVFRFLDVNESFESPGFSRTLHESSRKRLKTRLGIVLWEHLAGLRRHVLSSSPYKYNMGVYRRFERLLFLPLSRRIERPVLDDKQRERVSEYLKEDIEMLREFTGTDFEEWRGR